jgi:hypothetical protein
MGKDVKQAKDKMLERKRSGTHNTCEKPQDSGDRNTKRGWRDVFDNITYSSGPGDNIYVFG